MAGLINVVVIGPFENGLPVRHSFCLGDAEGNKRDAEREWFYELSVVRPSCAFVSGRARKSVVN